MNCLSALLPLLAGWLFGCLVGFNEEKLISERKTQGREEERRGEKQQQSKARQGKRGLPRVSSPIVYLSNSFKNVSPSFLPHHPLHYPVPHPHHGAAEYQAVGSSPGASSFPFFELLSPSPLSVSARALAFFSSFTHYLARSSLEIICILTSEKCFLVSYQLTCSFKLPPFQTNREKEPISSHRPGDLNPQEDNVPVAVAVAQKPAKHPVSGRRRSLLQGLVKRLGG